MQADRNGTGKDTMAYHWILKKYNTMGCNLWSRN
jgi:hypothetical protein